LGAGLFRPGGGGGGGAKFRGPRARGNPHSKARKQSKTVTSVFIGEGRGQQTLGQFEGSATAAKYL